MEIGIHEIKHQVDVSVVLSPNHILQSNDIFMAVQFLKEDDLSEGSLSIGCILKSVEVFLQSNDLLSFLVNGFPNDTISTLAY
jgi:hypothetical protein